MKRNILYGAGIVSALLVTSLVTVAFGQPGIGGGRGAGATTGTAGAGQPGNVGGMHQQMAPPAHTIVKFGAGSVYTLTGMTLTQFDAVTLKQTGTVTLEEIAEPAAPAAQPNAAAGNQQPPMMRPMRHQGPPTFVIVNNAAIIICGDTFYRVSLVEMKVTVKSDLPKPAIDAAANAPQAGAAPAGRGQGGPGGKGGGPGGQGGPGMGGPGEQGGAPGGQGGGPGMGGPGGQGGPGMGGPGMAAAEPVINGDIMYLARGKELLAINIVNGNVTAQATVPSGPKAAK